MSDQVYLKCQIIEETKAERTVVSKLFDGTSFEIKTPYWNVATKEDNAWLLVQVMGRDVKNNKLSVQLPSPALTLGHIVSVAIADTTNVLTG